MPTESPTVDPNYIQLLSIVATQNDTINALQIGLNTLQVIVDNVETGENEYPVDISLGSFSSGATVEFDLSPTSIPSNALKIQFYIQQFCGSSSPDSNRNIITTVVAHGRSFTHRFLFHPYSQSAYSTNSDNVWFPYPSDNIITVTSDSWSSNCGGTIRILRYSL